MNRRFWIVLSLLLVVTMLATACVSVPQAPAPAAAPKAPETVTLLWAFWGSPEEAVSHKMVAYAFTKVHPEIKIETWNQPWNEYFTKIKALWASGDPKVIPDLAFLWPTPKYAAQGVLENLDPYIKKAGYNLNDYWGGLLESAKYNGSVYGFQRDIEVNVLYYNKALFDKAGVKYPDENWTWNELLAAAEKLTVNDASGKVTRYGLVMESGKYAKWVNQNGGAILDDYRNPSKCMLADPKSVEAIKFFADMMAKGYAMRDADLNQA